MVKIPCWQRRIFILEKGIGKNYHWF